MEEEYCFVIMPIKGGLDGVYKSAIKQAVANTGLKCIRMDEVDKGGNIVRGIVAKIAKAKVLIADLTNQNPNVFYELGIANSLGNNTIMIAQSIDFVPFDVKPYNVIIYSNTIDGGEELKAAIESRIRNLEEWANSPSNPVQDFLPDKIVRQQDYKELREENEDYKTRLDEAYREIADKTREAEMYLKFLTQFVGEGKSSQASGDQIIDKAKDMFKEIQEKGEVSVNVQADGTDGKKKRIKFTKIN